MSLDHQVSQRTSDLILAYFSQSCFNFHRSSDSYLMNRAVNLKDSTLKRRRSSGSGESHRDAYSGDAMDGTVRIEKLPVNIDGSILVKSFRYLYHILYSKTTFSNYILPIVCVIGISVDPFFLFIPFVDDTKKCVGLDKRLGFNAVIIRCWFDLYYLPYIAHRRRRRFLRFIDLLATLPLPQVVILIVIPAMEGSKLLYTIQLLKLCVIFQFVPRFIAIYELVAGKFDRATLARVALNLFLLMLAGHVFGSFWYFFAIEREIECWKEACLSHTGCDQGSFYCDDNLGDYKFLNGFCPTKTRDTAIYDFGIFYDALQSGVVEATNFPQKFLYCFLWGLKTLSSFGSNLQLSGNGLESFFATLMIIGALVLSFLFFGNIQAYLQSEVVRVETLRSLEVQELEKQPSFEKHSKNPQKQSKTERSDGVALAKQMSFEMHSKDNRIKNLQKQSKNERSEEVALAVQEIEEWIPFQKLSEDLQNQVKTYQQYIYQKTKDINMENLLNNLPKGITRNIKRELCLKQLKKVEEFKNLSYIILDELCDCLKPASYEKGTLIIEKGEPVYGMHFLLRGTVLRYANFNFGYLTSTGDNAKNASGADILADGDFFGREVIIWARMALDDSSLPFTGSTFSIQTSTNVEAFVLMADDLKNAFKYIKAIKPKEPPPRQFIILRKEPVT